MSKSVFRFLSRPADSVLIEGGDIYLRLPEMGDYEAWRRLRLESRRFLEPWEPTWAPDDLARTSFRLRVKRYEQDFARGLSVPLFLFLRGDHTLVGGLTLGYIRRGAAQSSMIGYWMGETYAGKGLMRSALDVVVPYAFEVLRLHRIEAACIPDNTRSINLLEKAGFQREGYLRGYLKINGVWRDHVLYARVAERYGNDSARKKRARTLHHDKKTVA
jgi:ribosomal-protein-alanine N-acetyltransferase